MASVLTAAVPAGLAASRVAAADSTSQEPRRLETQDDLLVRVEKRVPGFGGMFVDAEGRLTVYLLDTSQLAAARAAIEFVFGPGRVPAAGIRAVRGRYSVSQLKMWMERGGDVLSVPGVTLVDLDEASNRVAIGVDDRTRIRAVEQALASLKVPREAVVIQVTGPIRQLDAR
jgi:hypothetical protein